MVQYQLLMGFRDADHRRGGERINKALENAESTLAEYAGMADQLVRYLAIEEALQDEIKYTLEHNNQSYGEWCAQTDKEKISTSFS